MDPADDGEEPHLLFLLTHEIKSGDDQVLFKRLQFVRRNRDGSATLRAGHRTLTWKSSRLLTVRC